MADGLVVIVGGQSGAQHGHGNERGLFGINHAWRDRISQGSADGQANALDSVFDFNGFGGHARDQALFALELALSDIKGNVGSATDSALDLQPGT